MSETIRRAPRPRRTAVGEHFLVDNDMSLEATGFLARVLSWPEDTHWTDTADLARTIGAPEDVVRAAVKELVELGRVKESPRRTGLDEWVTDLSIYGRAWEA